MFLNNLALLFVLGASPAFANLVQDGSFEGPLGLAWYSDGPMGAWTVLGVGVGIYPQPSYKGANVTDGNQAFDLGMGGGASGYSISQVLPTLAGQTYRLSFDWGSEYALGTSAFVSVGDLNVNLVDPVRGVGYPYSSTRWIVHSSSFLFVASGNDTLTFGEPDEPFDGGGLALDNVSVVELSPPQLALLPSGSDLVLKWPTDATGFVLESATTLANGGDWQDFPTAPSVIDGQNVVTITATGPCGFFRLRKP